MSQNFILNTNTTFNTVITQYVLFEKWNIPNKRKLSFVN